MVQLIKRLWSDQRGATAIEYAMMAGGIALVLVAAVSVIGTKVQAQFASVAAGFH